MGVGDKAAPSPNHRSGVAGDLSIFEIGDRVSGAGGHVEAIRTVVDLYVSTRYVGRCRRVHQDTVGALVHDDDILKVYVLCGIHDKAVNSSTGPRIAIHTRSLDGQVSEHSDIGCSSRSDDDAV